MAPAIPRASVCACVLVMLASGYPVSGAVPLKGPPSDGPLFTGQRLPVGNNPRRLAVADLDADGHNDLIVPVGSDATLAVFLGSPDGLVALDPLPLGGNPFDIEVVDLNDDGHLDVVSTLFDASVLVLEGLGDGRLSPAGTHPVRKQPVALASGDFDGNGTIDIAVASNDSNTITILPGRGDLTFGVPQTLGIGDDPQDIIAHDIDGDGTPELIVANLAGNHVTLLERTPGGLFTVAATLPIDLPRRLDCADMNKDGFPDLLVTCIATNFSGCGVGQFLGRGDGSFEPLQVVTPTDPGGSLTDPTTPALAVDDWNADGLPDIAVTGRKPAHFTVMLNIGGGEYEVGPEYDLFSGPVFGALPDGLELATGDLDGDGTTEILLANMSDVMLLRVPPSSQLGVRRTPSSDYSGMIAVADVDANGTVDVLTSNGGPFAFGSEILYFAGTGDGTLLGPVATSVGGVTFAVDAAHLDGDDHVDFAATVKTSPTVIEIVVGLGQGDGSFQLAPGPAFGNQASGLQLVDVDQDGLVDVVVNEATQIQVSLGDGNGAFGVPTALPLTGTAHAFALGDMTGGDAPDLVTVEQSHLLVRLGDGQGGFAPPVAHALLSEGRGLEIVDINADGQTDVAVAVTSGVTVFFGTGAGQLGPPRHIPLVFPTDTLTSGDVDGDGDRDLVVAGRSGTNAKFALVPALASGMGEPLFFGSPTNITDVALVDLDGWGGPELLASAGSFPATLTVLTSMPAGPWTGLGNSLPGGAGRPRLSLEGTLESGTETHIALSRLLPNAPVYVFVGGASLFTPLGGGTLVPSPEVFGIVPTNSQGVFGASFYLPTLPPGTTTWWQAWIEDPAGPFGLAATNAVRGQTP